MKTKGNQKKINVITLGCSKNLVDSEVMLKQFCENGFTISHDADSAAYDISVVNTCGFINDAKQESIDTILKMAGMKKSGQIKKIIVTGCLSQRYMDTLKQEIPEVDAFFGVGQLKDIMQYLKADYKTELLGERILTNTGHFAYLKIAEGCDRNCSFCAIPGIRGKHASKPIRAIVHEASILAQNGVKELILVAQDLTYYGTDLYKKRNLSALLEKLSAIRGIEWIRLQYAYPAAFPMDILEVIRDHGNICNYLDIPFQHISNRILKSMKRGINSVQTMNLIHTIREKVPGIALRTSLIAGYPGETDKEFQQLMDFVREVRFDRLGVFSYSHEESTRAYLLPDDVRASVKNERVDKLMKLQSTISLEKNRQLIGKKMKVLVDREEGGFFISRTEFDSPEVDNEVLIEHTKQKIFPGRFYNVKIIGAESYDLYGSVV